LEERSTAREETRDVRVHTRGETEREKGSGMVCGVRARINSHPAALLFTI